MQQKKKILNIYNYSTPSSIFMFILGMYYYVDKFCKQWKFYLNIAKVLLDTKIFNDYNLPHILKGYFSCCSLINTGSLYDVTGSFDDVFMILGGMSAASVLLTIALMLVKKRRRDPQ